MLRLLRLLLAAVVMSSPSVEQTSVGGSGTATTTPSIILPAGSQAGRKVIVCASVNEAGGVTTAITWPAGWNKPPNDAADNTGSQDAGFIAYRDCDGTEGASMSPTLTVAGNYSFACLRIAGAAPGAPIIVWATDGGATPSQPDPPANTPAGGGAEYLWIAGAMWDSGLNNWSAYPANYSGGIKFDSSDNGGVALAGIAVATRQLNAATEDPGAFTLTTADQYCAATIAVAPAQFITPVTNPLPSRFMKAKPRFNTAIQVVSSISFRRTLHPFGAGSGKRTKGR